ncbi:PAP2 superfamily C-terminal-domain-containing protein [Gorgonomyces haynaldii]|nr:PAP2 superfamily C-terminal-domain-containing protein [Gorgonomyces haynaldii]
MGDLPIHTKEEKRFPGLPWTFWKQQFTQRPYLGYRLVGDIIVLGITYVLAGWAANRASYLSPTFEMRALPDQLFNVLPEIQLLSLTDVFADTAAGLGLLLCVYRLRDSFVPAVQFAECLVVSYMLRSAVVAVTNMPDSRTNCDKVPYDQLFTNFSSHRCGDAMFSGHSILLATSALVWTSYFEPKSHVLYYIAVIILWLICFGGMLVILLNRTHYSADVIVALYVCTGVWFSYRYLQLKYHV